MQEAQHALGFLGLAVIIVAAVWFLAGCWNDDPREEEMDDDDQAN